MKLRKVSDQEREDYRGEHPLESWPLAYMVEPSQGDQWLAYPVFDGGRDYHPDPDPRYDMAAPLGWVFYDVHHRMEWTLAQVRETALSISRCEPECDLCGEVIAG